jgi:hypothetical protein
MRRSRLAPTPIELIGDGVEHDQLGVGVLLAVEAEVAEGQKAQADGGLMSYGIDLPNLFRRAAADDGPREPTVHWHRNERTTRVGSRWDGCDISRAFRHERVPLMGSRHSL